MWERRFKIQRGEEVSGQEDLREEAQDAMLGVAKNENDSCGIQKLIVKKTNLLMACACALSNPALPPLLSSVKHFPGDAAPVHQLGSMRPFVAHNSKIPSLA